MSHNQIIDEFYSCDSPETWKKIIGKDLHYHYGYFSSVNDTLDNALQQAVRNFYPHIPKGANVLDAGCGWGGPAKMLCREHGCNVTGITISKSQYEYCRSIGMNVIHDDFGRTELDTVFDVIIMFESLEHVLDKAALFIKWRQLSKKLVIQTTCAAKLTEADRAEYGNTMYLDTPENICSTLERTGWRVRIVKNHRSASKPTLKHWKARLQQEFQYSLPAGHLRELFDLSNYALANWENWSQDYPLINIIAE